jgi:small GTP-binding protein
MTEPRVLPQRKICLLGAFAVGKTSLVRRFVEGIFRDRYTTTIGVRMYRKQVEAGARPLNLIIWDVAGEDEFQQVNANYLRGASGYLLVADGTRRATIETARLIRQRMDEKVGAVPFVFVVNKSDLTEEWEIDQATLDELARDGWQIIRSSARSGDGVEEAFAALAARL